jgi:carbonic anhydrase
VSMDKLLAQNQAWSERMQRHDSQFFSRLERQQTPRCLWIGCSDSHVAANQILDLAPGEVFAHRNIANLVVQSDLNCLSVSQFSVDILLIRQIMVVGHYGCSGIRAAQEDQRFGLIDNWIKHIHELRGKHHRVLDQYASEQQINILCELNVAEQFMNLCRTTILQDAWKRGQRIAVQGLVYSLHDGLLRELGLSADSACSAERA